MSEPRRFDAQEANEHATSWRRRVRHAGYAALAFALFQLVAFGGPLWRDAGRWIISPLAPVQIGILILGAAAVWRGSLVAAGVLGAYGAFRLAWFAVEVARVLTGSAVGLDRGSSMMATAALSVIFSVIWLRGGLAALRLHRDRAAAGVGP